MAENLLLSRIREYMKSEDMGLPMFVALSGGPDSVCLLHAMTRLNQESAHPLQLIAVHCNFHLRGEESDRDERFCQALCKMLGVQILVRQFDTYSYMKEKGLSLEMAARQLRYEWWKVLTERGEKYFERDAYIALGHHADDSIETMLMNLMRGTGMNGLTGIVPINHDKHTIRPLLCLSRAEILQYLEHEVPCPEGWDCNYVTDHTNAENDTLRNQIRNQLLPLMETMVPQARHGMTKTMSIMREAADVNNKLIHKIIDIHQRTSSADGYTYYTIETSGFTDFEKYEISHYYEGKGYTVAEVRDTMIITDPSLSIPTEHLPDCESRIQPERFDADKIEQPVIWRRWRQGDRIDPLGMNGKTRKLSDLFSDAHYLPIQKHLAWVITDAKDRILWVPGLKRCDFAKVTAETQHVLTIKY